MHAGILPGPPGTGKTYLVEQIAEDLAWPFVVVPASAIFERGFDLMEARGDEVFRNLQYLRRCVIFFDEFEEFFLIREQDTADGDDKSGGQHDGHKATFSPHNRTIAAFTTSAMLPRLQALHKGHQCLVFLATNYPDKIDKAVVRPGRFDFTICVDHARSLKALTYQLDSLKFKDPATLLGEFGDLEDLISTHPIKLSELRTLPIGKEEDALRRLVKAKRGAKEEDDAKTNDNEKTREFVKKPSIPTSYFPTDLIELNNEL